MIIKYLGTAAAEGIPAIFCECDTCKKSRILGGKNIRTRSQAIIDNVLLIDFGPDTYLHSLRFNIDLTKIRNCLITHAHSDHLLYDDITFRRNGFCSLKESSHQLNIYGGNGVKKVLNPNIKGYVYDNRVKFNYLKVYQKYVIDGYEIIPLPAVHTSEEPLVYVIRKDKTILYCHDSGILEKEVFDFLKKNNIVFDLISLDCTHGKEGIEYVGHMNFERNKIIKKLFIEYDLVNESTKFVVNHFSHNSHTLYQEACDLLKDEFIVSYDGLEVEI